MLGTSQNQRFLLGINSAVQAVDYQALWGFFLWYPGHLWICSPSIPPFYIDWRWRCWRPRKIERELDRGSNGPKKIQNSASTTSVHGEWPTTTGPWKRLTPAQGNSGTPSVKDVKNLRKKQKTAQKSLLVDGWSISVAVGAFLTVPIGLFHPLPCCSTLWV